MDIRKHLLVCSAAALLAACGGGGGGGNTPEPPTPPAASDAVPDSAGKTAQGLVDWMKALTRENDAAEHKAPLEVSNFMPPLSDDSEPLPVR